MSHADLLSPIKLIILDVDGVLAKNVIYAGTAQELKMFNTKDGFGITMCRKVGIKTGVLTGRSSEPVHVRMSELKLDYYAHGHFNKEQALLDMIKEAGVNKEEILYMGDDILDLVCQQHVGVFACPADAVQRVMHDADFVAQKNGGEGCVREVIEAVLNAKGILRDTENQFI